MPRLDYKHLLDDLIERRAAQWALRGKMRGSFDEPGYLQEGDSTTWTSTWTQESTPRQDWWPLILLARKFADLTP